MSSTGSRYTRTSISRTKLPQPAVTTVLANLSILLGREIRLCLSAVFERDLRSVGDGAWGGGSVRHCVAFSSQSFSLVLGLNSRERLIDSREQSKSLVFLREVAALASMIAIGLL